MDTPRGFRDAAAGGATTIPAVDESEAHAYRLGGDPISTPHAGWGNPPSFGCARFSHACRSESPVRSPTKFSGRPAAVPFSFRKTTQAGVGSHSGPRTGNLQFTKRRRRTLLTRPSIRNIDNILEPPALISGRGIPVTGMRPTTIPTLTRT